jgi:iron complex outermembrane receptor protein
MPVGDDLQLELGLNAQYSSKFLRGLGRFDGVPGITQPAYTKINANIGFGPADEAWQFSVIGNNLTDKFTAGNCTTFSASTGQVLLPTLGGAVARNAAGLDELACIPERGREVFVRFSVKFNGF